MQQGAESLRNYIDSTKQFIARIESGTVDSNDFMNTWYSSYTDSLRIKRKSKREVALSHLLVKMRFDIKASEIRLGNYIRNGNFGIHPDEVGFQDVTKGISDAYNRYLGKG